MSPELLIYRGLPGSGKTTLAKAWVAEDPEHRARVNRDDLRWMLHDGVWLGDKTEKQIVRARDSVIRNLLSTGISVASDDTNLPQKTAKHLAEQGALFGATVRVVDLTDVPFAECVRRDAARERSVGEDVIRGMYERYLKGRAYPLPPVETRLATDAEVYVPKPGTPPAIMVDLDGTLCLHNGRSPYDESRVGEDLPNEAVVRTVLALSSSHRVIFCSGRTEACRVDTENWIRRFASHNPLYEGDYWDLLLMRAVGDVRKDAIVKRELFDRYIRDRYDVEFVLDDRQQVVDAWRELGLTVFQVAPGNF